VDQGGACLKKILHTRFLFMAKTGPQSVFGQASFALAKVRRIQENSVEKSCREKVLDLSNVSMD
jgi:hypothetical protein